VQTLDYYPYGSLRLNTRSTNLDEKRKFTGHEYDSEVGLTYMGARYYDGARGQFLSQDPAYLAIHARNTDLVSDPQQLNSYSYGRGNPLAYKDSDGKKVELVTRPAAIVGAHSFILITNTPEAASKLDGVPNGVKDPTRITLGGYTKNLATGNLEKGANDSSDFNLSEKDYIERREILAPSQYNGDQAAFENAVINSYNNLDSDLGAYSFFGDPSFNGQANSNNVATSILTGAGVDKDVIRGSRPESTHLLDRVATPGLGTQLPANSKPSLSDRVQSVKNSVSKFFNRLWGR
jgi:RHS repeat-associated protein